ncbi:U11/U12 small nuclear ribonucleoprotein 48 kDa protein [Hyalella azteca]|uniref:U11/U12 small nuclear ribonucleoprotein 48 kDa protein n=1 Tax=Hyalella azteca TaxID=294128 RepID=A0A8B7NTY6_HYAAZ|nr:U11/U12 small nuclear ribonucleoprotein 48 kDa protein [Hyalella azteca]
METENINIKEYEDCLSDFYSAVHWNDEANNCVNKLSTTATVRKSSSTSAVDDDENPYSNEPLLPPPYPIGSSISPKSSSRITIDSTLQREILKPFWKSDAADTRPPPSCLAHEWLLFSREERKALYEYVLLHTQAPPPPPQLVLQPVTEINDSKDEVVIRQQQRDLKRRRQAYRTAATGSKTLTEVTREMINNVMELIGIPVDDQKSKSPSETRPLHSRDMCSQPSTSSDKRRTSRCHRGHEEKESKSEYHREKSSSRSKRKTAKDDDERKDHRRNKYKHNPSDDCDSRDRKYGRERSANNDRFNRR